MSQHFSPLLVVKATVAVRAIHRTHVPWELNVRPGVNGNVSGLDLSEVTMKQTLRNYTTMPPSVAYHDVQQRFSSFVI